MTNAKTPKDDSPKKIIHDVEKSSSGKALLYDPKTGKVHGTRVVNNDDSGNAPKVDDYIDVSDDENVADVVVSDVKRLVKDEDVRACLFISAIYDDEVENKNKISIVSTEYGLDNPYLAMAISHACGYLISKMHMNKVCQMEDYELCLRIMRSLANALHDGMLENLTDLDRRALANLVDKLDERKTKSNGHHDS